MAAWEASSSRTAASSRERSKDCTADCRSPSLPAKEERRENGQNRKLLRDVL